MEVVIHICWRHSCNTVSVSILCCQTHCRVFRIYQEVLSPLIESIKTFVDNLAVLNSRYFHNFSMSITYFDMFNWFDHYWFYLPCREEDAKEHGNDEASERTNPRKSLEEEYLETEKKVLLSYLALTWFHSMCYSFLQNLIYCACFSLLYIA